MLCCSELPNLLLSLMHTPTSPFNTPTHPQAAIDPALTGISSSRQPHGIIDTINRALFGGRLIYFGPAYFSNIFGGPLNLFNTTCCWVLNPWAYNSTACKKLFDRSLDMINQVEQELNISSSSSSSTAAVQGQPEGHARTTTNATAAADSSTNGSAPAGGVSKDPMVIRSPAGAAPVPDVSAVVGGSSTQTHKKMRQTTLKW
jgi:hypothetical protein